MAGTGASFAPHLIGSTESSRALRTGAPFSARISTGGNNHLATTRDDFAAGPYCIYVGPIETASKETLEALYRQARDAYYSGDPLIVDDMFDRVELKLRWYGSKCVVKYPRCSLRRQSAYADAEADVSQVFALASIWILFLAFGSASCLMPIIYTVGLAYQDALSPGLSYANQAAALSMAFQKNSTLPSRVLTWIQYFEPRSTPLPVVIVQECLTAYIQKQVDCIGRHVLSKLMNDWKLMDELAVLRAIYLLGSGDLLQHFLTVIFNKLDKGETWDDDFELNTILQESIRNSADGVLLSVPDSLVVSLTKNQDLNGNEQPSMASLPSTPHKSRANSLGMDGLDLLQFTYKVSWPLELIANAEAIKKYNQVMGFLLKVKRAKFVLDKARRWMWKGRGRAANSYKHHWLVEQKLLHFVDAFHQYVMDRVYHNAWRELCEGMAAARSLDEVIEVHDLYLLTIQRQCFVVPDKLWALIATRINNILGLALDFYSIQLTLSGGAVSAIKAKCEMEVDRIEKQFDDCIAFLLRVLSFKLNVGHFPHLADLVTRINYNHFYMSDTGNLRTLPSSENITSRLGKAFLGRTD